MSSLDNCPTPQPASPDFFNKAAELAKSMGMDEKCQQAAKTAAATVAAKASALGGFLEAGFAATYMDNEMQQSGCGSFSLNANQIYNANNTINCQIQKSSTSSNTSQINSQSISIITLDLSDKEIEQYNKSLELVSKTSVSFASLIANAKDEKNAKNLQALLDTALKALNESMSVYKRDINIKNSSISQRVNAKLTSSISITDEIAAKISEQQKIIAEATAENLIKNTAGVNALGANTKSGIVQNVSNNTLFNSQNIKDTVSKFNLTQDNNQTLVIKSPGNINLENVKLDQDIISQLITNTLSNNATSVGVSIATEILSSTASKLSVETEQAGLDDLQKQLGDTNTNALKEIGSGLPMMIIGIICLIGLFVFGGFTLFGKLAGNLTNNIMLVVGISIMIYGIILVTKTDIGNKVVGSILILAGFGALCFGIILKLNMNKMDLLSQEPETINPLLKQLQIPSKR